MNVVGRLSGKRVLITGASSGIGLEAARLFASEGARLALLARSEDALEQATHDLRVDAVVLSVDVTDRRAVEKAVEEAVARLGGLDIFVSNAAAGAFGHLLEVSPDDFDRAHDITFRGAVNVVRAALPHLRESHGAIVATGSLLSRVPMPSWSAYVAAKHALRGFLNSIAVEEREQRTGVCVAMVHPGVIDTPFWASASSATGAKPRVPPAAYSARAVAQALVETAARPRRELVLGGGTLLFDRTYPVLRPIAERVLVVFDRWLRSGEDEAPRPGALWQPTARPQTGAGIPARHSVLASSTPGVGTRAGALVRLVGHAGAVALRAVTLRSALRTPTREGLHRKRVDERPESAIPRERAST